MSLPARQVAAAPDLGSLDAITQAVEGGLGLPEVVRAAARALDASLVLIDRSSGVLAVAARSSADERSLMTDAPGVVSHELRVGDSVVGRLRLRGRSGAEPPAALLRVVSTLIASEVERLRAPERASEAAQAAFLRAVLQRAVTDRGDLVARGEELGIDLSHGGAVVVVRAHHLAPTEDDWRARVLGAAERAARTSAPGSLAAVIASSAESAGQVVLLVPEVADDGVRRVAESIARELQTSLHGFTFAVGHSRVAHDPVDLYRAGNEALLAANVAETRPAGLDKPARVLAVEDTGAHRPLLPALNADRADLQRFYTETVEPLVAYDAQYETDLVQTLETFLECDGNVAGTAQRLYTHRHTVRYRLERGRDPSGLDVGSTGGRGRPRPRAQGRRGLGPPPPPGPARQGRRRGGPPRPRA